MELKKGNYNISYTSSEFDNLFGATKTKPKKIKPNFRTLEEEMTSQQILNKLKPQDITLDELAYLLNNNILDKNKGYICFIQITDTVLHAVYFYWLGVGWRLSANQVSIPRGWYGGDLILSSNFLDTLELEHFNPLELEFTYKGSSYKITKK